MIRRTLSPRQLEILRLIAGGLTDKEIAYNLSIQQSTVGHHVQIILSKLDARSRSQAVFVFFVIRKKKALF